MPELIERVRGTSETCNASAAHAAAQKLFIRKADLLGEPTYVLELLVPAPTAWD